MIGELFNDLPESDPMRYILHEEKCQLNGTWLRLLRYRNEVTPKPTEKEIEDKKEPPVKISRTKNELCASFYDEKKSKYRDIIRMTVADTLPEAMPEFLSRSRKEIERLLPRFADVDKTARKDCQTVGSFPEFAEALKRR